jgi:predicted enzyme related to lactoylglutathione lyase
MRPPALDPIVHLELHTGNRARASDFYTRLFGWRAETVEVGHSTSTYLTLKLGGGIEGGIVEHDGEDSLWLPYVEVADLMAVTERARGLGAAVVLEPREGPVGWRSILDAPSGARIALWQPKV